MPEGGRDYAFGDAFPHEALMDQLGGVDFRKGCYVGQEVVSRMQHRGTARTRILAAAYADAAPAPGTEITAGGKVIGTTGSAAGPRGLATVRLDRLGDALAAGETPRAGDRPVTLERPGCATFAMPDAAARAAAETGSRRACGVSTPAGSMGWGHSGRLSQHPRPTGSPGARTVDRARTGRSECGFGRSSERAIVAVPSPPRSGEEACSPTS